MEHQVHVGDIVDVTITGIQPYGAFALLPDGSSGLIHISEISYGYVKNNEMTWQKFYEIYDIYGENNDVWIDYLKEKETTNLDFFSFLKTIDMDKIQEGVESLQRVVGVIGEMAATKEKSAQDNYKPRPLYKHFDD